MTETLKSIHGFLAEARLHVRKKNYLASLAIVERVRPLLGALSADDLPAVEFHEAWGCYFRQKLKCLQHLGSPDALRAACHAILERFPIDAVNCAEQPLITRQNARKALAKLAKFAMEQGDLDAAVSLVTRCFALQAGNDELDDPFVSSYALRAGILMAAYRGAPKAYQVAFFESLYDLECFACDGCTIGIEDPELAAFLDDSAYRAYRGRTPIELLRRGPPGESWKAALDRFRAIGKEMQTVWNSPLDSRHFDLEITPVQPLELELHENRNVRAPDSLRALYCAHGGFAMAGAAEGLIVYGADQYGLSLFGGIVQMIRELWGERPEFSDDFTDDEVDFLNQNFLVFGQICHDPNTYSHLMFDREGRFGSVRYDQDNWCAMELEIRKMVDGERVCFHTLDELISEKMDAAIHQLICIDYRARLQS